MKKDVPIGGSSNASGFQIFDSNGIRVKTKDYFETADVRIWRKASQIRAWMLRPFSLGILLMLTVLGIVLLAVASILSGVSHNGYLPIFGIAPCLVCLSWLLVMLGSFLTEIVMDKWFDLEEWWVERHGILDPRLDDKVREWHSCEHKIIHLLEQRRKITILAVQKAPSYSSDCGSGRGQEQLDWLKEPSLEKIKETVRVGQEYYKKLQKKNKSREGKKK